MGEGDEFGEFGGGCAVFADVVERREQVRGD